MSKLIILLLACTNCPIEKLVFEYDSNKYLFCSDRAYEIYQEIAEFHWYEKGKYNHSAYYTPEGKIIIGHLC